MASCPSADMDKARSTEGTCQAARLETGKAKVEVFCKGAIAVLDKGILIE